MPLTNVPLSGPYIQTNYELGAAMICYSLRSVVENNQQPMQKKEHKDFSKFKSAFYKYFYVL